MKMKMNQLMLFASTLATAVLLVGCNESQSTKTTPASAAPSGAAETAASLKDAAQQAVDSVKQTATAVANQAKDAAIAASTQAQQAVGNAAAALNNQAQNLINQAEAFVHEKKYQEALNSLKGLAGLELTAEQQKAVDDLKTTINNALGSDAVKSVEGLFKK